MYTNRSWFEYGSLVPVIHDTCTPVIYAGFTGIDQEYEAPHNPDLVLRAGDLSIDECVQDLVQLLKQRVRIVIQNDD